MSRRISIKNRQEYNNKIVNLLSYVIAANPDLRFGQIVECFCKNVDDDLFNLESEQIYKILTEKMRSLNDNEQS